MNTHTYRILLSKEPEGGYTVKVPALPGCITFGQTVDDAIEQAKEAISLYIESLVAHGEQVPDDKDTLEYSLTLTA
ncbi:MAG: type II toxin-antitoxin system HicB family antitoxin [Bacteroidota bacterium]